MSQLNLDVVRSMYEAFDGGDPEGALAHFHPDVVLDSTARPDGGVAHGREQLNSTIGRWLAAFEEWREDIEEMRDLGGLVLVVATQRGRGKGSGIDVETRYALLYEVREAKIIRMTMFTDLADALAEASAQERPTR
jgi:ketosteroid isomerase-like protein